MNKHTPGSWFAEAPKAGYHKTWWVMAQGGMLCRCIHNYPLGTEEANARFIAKAPEMAGLINKLAYKAIPFDQLIREARSLLTELD